MVSPMRGMLFISRKLLALFMPDVKVKWISSVLKRLLRGNYLQRREIFIVFDQFVEY